MTCFKPVLGVSALIVHAERVLLAKRGLEPAEHLWSLPGGKVKSGETLQAAAARELQEETGIAMPDLRFAELVEIIEPDYHFVIAVFTGLLEKEQTPIAGDDAEEARWFTSREIDNLDAKKQITPGTRQRIISLTKNL